MASTAQYTTSTTARDVGEGRYSAPVIADAGDDAWVVLVHSQTPLGRGTRFVFGGLDWEIVRDRDALRGFVAWPVIRPAAAR